MTATRLKFIAVLALAATLVSLVALHAQHMNGPWYWKWMWRDATTVAPTRLLRWYPAMLAAAVPIIAAWFLSERSGLIWIVLLIIGVVAIKLVSISIDAWPLDFTKLAAIVRSPDATSYFSDASALVNFPNWLAAYPQILPETHLHTQSKPPGAVAYYMLFIRALGYSERAAIVAGVVQAVLAAFSIPAVYLMIRVLTDNRDVARVGAILMTVCPGYLIIYPSFDAIWPIFAAAMIVSWHLALVRNDWRCALVFGAVLAAACFFTYNVLTLGAFLLAWTIVRGSARVALLVATAIGTFSLLYLIFWLFTGFNPIGTFLAAYGNQHTLLARFISQRPYPATIWFDLVDFALGAGWIVVLLAMFGVAREWTARHRWLVLLCVAQPLLIAVTGLLQAETARVWNFMLPLLIVPAALELSGWPRGYRVATYAALLLAAVVIGREMIFMAA